MQQVQKQKQGTGCSPAKQQTVAGIDTGTDCTGVGTLAAADNDSRQVERTQAAAAAAAGTLAAAAGTLAAVAGTLAALGDVGTLESGDLVDNGQMPRR